MLAELARRGDDDCWRRMLGSLGCRGDDDCVGGGCSRALALVVTTIAWRTMLRAACLLGGEDDYLEDDAPLGGNTQRW